MAPGLGVEPGGGFVQEQDRRVVNQRGGDGKALFLPPGQVLVLGLGPVLQLDLGQDLRRPDPLMIKTGKDRQDFGKVQLIEEG